MKEADSFSRGDSTISVKLKDAIKPEKKRSFLAKESKKNTHKLKESKQENLILREILDDNCKKLKTTSRKLWIVSGTVTLSLLISFLAFGNVVGGSYSNSSDGFSDSFVVQNLRGDTVQTYMNWQIFETEPLFVNVIGAGEYPEKFSILKNVVNSVESVEISDSEFHKGPKGSTSQYYLGWKGAILEAKTYGETLFEIPTNFNIVSDATEKGDIIVRFEESKNMDGYSGYTSSIIDEDKKQILKSQVIIYDINNISNEDFELTLRHEFGHAMGLAHSTDVHDLMHPEVSGEIPYISQCSIRALYDLYNGNPQSEVTCQK